MMWEHFQIKQELIDYLMKNEHCYDAYWAQRNYLREESNKFYCDRCGTIVGGFNFDMVWWEAYI